MLKIQALACFCVLDHSVCQRKIFRVNSFKYEVHCWSSRGLVTKDPKSLIRPNQFTGRQIPNEAAGVTERLRLLAIRLAPPQLSCRILLFSNVYGGANALFKALV